MMRSSLGAIALAWLTIVGAGSAPAQVEIKAPGGHVRLNVFTDKDHPRFEIHAGDVAVLGRSTMGVVVDGVDLGQGAEIGRVESYDGNEVYPTRGVHSKAVNRYSGARIALRHAKSGRLFQVDARVFDDGVAFRHIVPGDDSSVRTPDEATTFRLLPESTVWYHDLRGHYEGVHAKKRIEDVKAGEWSGPPLVAQHSPGGPYLAITEGGLAHYAGMALEADGASSFVARLGHAHPASHPFTLRYGEDGAKRLASPATVKGTITTPWRIVIVAPDLNALVNSDVVNNVAEPPDRRLFPDGMNTPWIKPGRCVWKYLDGGANTLDEMKEFSRLAGELGFEYNLIEGFWQRWTDLQLRELVDYSKSRGVGIFLWKHSKDIKDPVARREFFKRCKDAGAAGAKIDFFDHEAKEVIEHYEACLRDAAEFQLMVDFHGANKPAGESRTWPNEMTREGIFGLEHRSAANWARHNTAFPFTRMIAGHADYTPVHFGDRRRETSWAHQIATAAVVTSPLLVYAAHPKNLLANPAVELIKSIPSVWDETIVLPASEIGELAMFARRSGDRWFLAVLNGPAPRSVKIPVSFLEATTYDALLVRDVKDEPAAVKLERTSAKKGDSIDIDLRAGGGFIARFTKQ
jgi:alpha-glucosidase